MSSKSKFHNLNRKFFRGYVMSSPFVKTCLQRVNSVILTRKFFRGYVMSSPFVKICLQRVNPLWRQILNAKGWVSIPYVHSLYENRSWMEKVECLSLMFTPFMKTDVWMEKVQCLSLPLWRHILNGKGWVSIPYAYSLYRRCEHKSFVFESWLFIEGANIRALCLKADCSVPLQNSQSQRYRPS